ncbi:redox-sensitive transcriptional activator SoxR [Pelagibius sp.]|uniref:redox-sensitive transcriptional activator SoxR n=1 Tax=Pelagibius sp. TaxID=1931238 RepID=UPI0026289A74|nr:redox-sensitive transcriptional activator SoxR [Pelagibius sp.]
MIKTLSIGRVAERTGLAVSAIRFYEEKGLVVAGRDAAGRRRFAPSDIRRLSFVLIAQQLGFSLEQIRTQLDALPKQRTPTARDWARISHSFRIDIDARIIALESLRESLTDCIGCGCLSLSRCKLYNPDDRAGRLGSGPRYLLGDAPNRDTDEV